MTADELTALAQLEAELTAEHDQIVNTIAADITAPTKPHEARLAGILAKLAAIPRRREALEAARAEAAHAAALAELEAAYKAIYDTEAAIDAMRPELEAARLAVAQLEARRAELRGQVDGLLIEASRLRRGGAVSGAEFSAIAARWQYLPADYQGYEKVMRRRAARGALPPGKSLKDFGITEE